MKETADAAEKYLKNERALLEEWYNDFYSTELFPGEPLAAMPSLDEIRHAFTKWVAEVKTQLYNLVCVEWDYPSKRNTFKNKITLAASLADFFISCTWKIPAPVATATLLVQMGLDRICGIDREGEN